MVNCFVEPEEMVKQTLELLEKHKIPELLAKASSEDRDAVLLELSNFFGGRFPK